MPNNDCGMQRTRVFVSSFNAGTKYEESFRNGLGLTKVKFRGDPFFMHIFYLTLITEKSNGLQWDMNAQF